MTPKRGRALVGALAVVGAVIAWPHAAAAWVCGFAVENPTPGSISSTSTVRLRGTFEVKEDVTAESRVLEITFVEAPGPLPPPLTRSGDIGPAGRFDIAVGPLARNGRYTARVKAIHAGAAIVNCSNGLGSEERNTERTVDAPFSVSVKASPPNNVRASFSSGARTVAVAWDKSGDPDIAGYIVARRVGSAAATEVKVAPDPLSWTDTKLPASAATITYSVRAVRNGANPGATSEPSDPTAAPPIKVPAPPPGATATTAPAGAATTVGTATTVPFVLTPPIGAALPADPAPPAFPADGSYQPPSLSLPDDQSGPLGGGDQAVVGNADAGGDEQIPQLAYVASALLSTVVAAHVLWLRRQVARPEPEAATRATPLEPLEPEPSLRPPPESPSDADGLSAFAPVPAATAVATPKRPAGGPDGGLRPEAADPSVILVPPREGTPVGADRRQPVRAVRAEPAGGVETGDPDQPDRGEAANDVASKPASKPVLILRPRRPEPP